MEMFEILAIGKYAPKVAARYGLAEMFENVGRFKDYSNRD